MSRLRGSIKQALSAEAKDIEQALIERKLDSLFAITPPEREKRRGLHASAIIVSDNVYCEREQILSLFYERNEEDNTPPSLKRIFREGDYVHKKWQDLFKIAGVAVAIEDRGYSPLFDLYMTPDAIIQLFHKKYVVEIKSVNTYGFKQLKAEHPSGTKQLQLYMHFTCIPNGFVLAEDKNTQEFKVLPVKYEPGQASKYVKRLYDLRDAKEQFIKKNILPKRICSSQGCQRAAKCPMSGACWGFYKKPLT